LLSRSLLFRSCSTIILLGVIALSLSKGPAVAQDATPPSSQSTSSAPRWEWDLSIRNRTGFRLESPRVLQMSRLLIEAKASYRISDQWRVTAGARANYDPVERLGYPDGVWIDPRQAYLDGRIKSAEVRLGLQQIVWGQADGLRVLDVINPLDYREFILEDFLDSRRPLWAARVDVPAGRGSLQMVWVPYFAPGRLPGPDAEFGLGQSYGLALLAAAAGLAPEEVPPLRLLPNERPGYQLSASQAGARYSRSVGGWDLTANYFYGWEDAPTPYLRGIEGTPERPTLLFGPRYERREVAGGTAATSFGPVVLRLEAGWNRRKPTPARNSSDGISRLGQFSSVAGADYSPREWLWVSGQYFLQFASAPQRDLIFPRYNHLASVYVRTNFFNDRLRPELFVLTGLNLSQYLIRPRVVRTFGDHFSAGFGADFFGGHPITAFGYFETRDRVVLELKWSR
jgi:hypothetical protein